MPLDDDRLATAATFVAPLFDLSRRSPQAWRRADAVGRSAGIIGQRLEQAIADAAHAGLVDRRVDDGGVLITARGRALAESRSQGTAAMRHELQSWVRLIALGVGVLAVVFATLTLSAPVMDLVALR
jgi:hypothetical protein